MDAIDRVIDAIRGYRFEDEGTGHCPICNHTHFAGSGDDKVDEVDILALANVVLSSINLFYIQEGVGLVDKIDYSIPPYSLQNKETNDITVG